MYRFELIFSCCFFCLISFQLNAQEVQSLSPKKNTIYLEAAGLGGFGALVYDRYLFTNRKLDFYSSIGISTLNLFDISNTFKPDIILPATISFLYGEKKHYLESGLGVVYTNFVKFNTTQYKIARAANVHSALLLGYRFKRPKKRFTFKIHYYFVLENFRDIRHWGGLGLGYQF